MQYSKNTPDTEIFRHAVDTALDTEQHLHIRWKSKWLDRYARWYVLNEYKQALFSDDEMETLERAYITRLGWMRNNDEQNGLMLSYNPFYNMWAIIPVYGYLTRDEIPWKVWREVYKV